MAVLCYPIKPAAELAFLFPAGRNVGFDTSCMEPRKLQRVSLG